MDKVTFAIPKGHLEDPTLKILQRAGYDITGWGRAYTPQINDPATELKILRPQEIPNFVSDGLQDIGITGLDWLRETHADVETMLDLEYSRVQIALAVPTDWSDIRSLSDLLKAFSDAEKPLRIWTEYPNLTAGHVKSNPLYRSLYNDADPILVTPWLRKGENERVIIYLSFGATEAKPPENADAIVDAVETGTSLEENKLKPIGAVMESTAVLIANKNSLRNPGKREKIYDIVTLLRGVVDGRKKLHIFVNVSKDNLDELLHSLPALRSPTIAPLSDENWYSVNTIIEREHFLEQLPTLRRLAQGLVVYEPRQVLSLDETTSREEES